MLWEITVFSTVKIEMLRFIFTNRAHFVVSACNQRCIRVLQAHSNTLVLTNQADFINCFLKQNLGNFWLTEAMFETEDTFHILKFIVPARAFYLVGEVALRLRH